MATWRFSAGSNALNTTPMPPRPISCRSTYSPNISPGWWPGTAAGASIPSVRCWLTGGSLSVCIGRSPGCPRSLWRIGPPGAMTRPCPPGAGPGTLALDPSRPQEVQAMPQSSQRLLGDVEAFCQEIRPVEELCYVEHKYNDQVVPLAKI